MITVRRRKRETVRRLWELPRNLIIQVRIVPTARLTRLLNKRQRNGNIRSSNSAFCCGTLLHCADRYKSCRVVLNTRRNAAVYDDTESCRTGAATPKI